ncbi:unnamed protein product [Agarophyton chilense]
MPDMKIVYGDINKYARCGKVDVLIKPMSGRSACLGTVKIGPSQPGANGHTFIVIHAYVIHACSSGDYVDLTGLYKAFKCIRDKFSKLRIAYPKIGEGLKGPSWAVICRTINSALKCCHHTVVVPKKKKCKPKDLALSRSPVLSLADRVGRRAVVVAMFASTSTAALAATPARRVVSPAIRVTLAVALKLLSTVGALRIVADRAAASRLPEPLPSGLLQSRLLPVRRPPNRRPPSRRPQSHHRLPRNRLKNLRTSRSNPNTPPRHRVPVPQAPASAVSKGRSTVARRFPSIPVTTRTPAGAVAIVGNVPKLCRALVHCRVESLAVSRAAARLARSVRLCRRRVPVRMTLARNALALHPAPSAWRIRPNRLPVTCLRRLRRPSRVLVPSVALAPAHAVLHRHDRGLVHLAVRDFDWFMEKLGPVASRSVCFVVQFHVS